MHELAVTQGMLDVALRATNDNGGRRITAIDLVIGDLSSIVDDSVQFYFDILSEGTLAEGAQLRFQREAASAVCSDCGTALGASPPLAPVCPHCGSARISVTGGRDMRLDSIEVADEDPRAAAFSQR